VTAAASPPPPTEALAQIWSYYSTNVYGAYAPLYSRLARLVAGDDDLLELVHAAPPYAHDPNVLLAAAHYLVLGGVDHPAARFFSDDPARDDAGPAFKDLCLTHRRELMEIMSSRRIQTNECGRSAVLAVGLSTAASRVGEPIALLDAGASAGLNLRLDRYLLDFGSFGRVGPDDSSVRVTCDVRGGNLDVPPAVPRFRARLGIDRSPIDLADPDGVRWLLACTWPGTGRLTRTSAAIGLAARYPVAIRRGDMVDDLPSALATLGDGPVAIVTSWSFSYLPPSDRPRFQEILNEEGRRRPVTWVSCEGAGIVEAFPRPGVDAVDGEFPSVLGLAVYDRTSVSAEALALVGAHGQWIDSLDARTSAQR
jgi:hypothetical protein